MQYQYDIRHARLLARRSLIEATANFAASADAVLFCREIIFSTEMDAIEVWRKILNFPSEWSILGQEVLYWNEE